MKCSDYIVQYLIDKKITDVFGYPGGMVTHLMDSFSKYQSDIAAHVTYHEQGAAFAACGYAQASHKVGVAYATSGPGATNLITGICNAYFDSIPVLFITGQVNTFESKGSLAVRQRGFQETDIVAMVDSVTKYSVRIEDANQIRYQLDKAFYFATSGRKGPVLLDIPMNVFRAEIDPNSLQCFLPPPSAKISLRHEQEQILEKALQHAKRPLILVGNGTKGDSSQTAQLRRLLHQANIPAVSTMPAVDLLADHPLYYGFIGAYGSRTANFLVAKCDVILSLGARLDVRQVGGKREKFAPYAKLVRVDIDAGELSYPVHEDECDICADVKDVLPMIEHFANEDGCEKYRSWIHVCDTIRDTLDQIDEKQPNRLLRAIGVHLPKDALITTDVGQNQVWVAQSLPLSLHQQVLFSGGHGAMGYSLPASIGAWYGAKRPTICFNGDGGFQMNLQELGTIQREQLPIKIIVLNNHALGMIRHFQEMYFGENYYQTVSGHGYEAFDFSAIAKAFGLRYLRIETEKDISDGIFCGDESVLIEVILPNRTYVFPKLEFGKENHDQEPLLDRDLFNSLMKL